MLTLITRFCALLALTITFAHAADFNAAHHGARGDSTTMNTAAVRNAIDAAAKKGGTVTFPQGTYLTGSILAAASATPPTGA